MSSTASAADFSFRTTTNAGEEEDLGVAKLSSEEGFRRASSSSSSPEKRRNRKPKNEFEEDEGGQTNERTAATGGTVVNHRGENYLNWGFSQVFGERAPNEEVQDADIISAVEFDRTGDWLATGDRGGRVVLFERVRHAKRREEKHPEDELEDVLMEEMSSEMQYNRDDQVGVMINNNNKNNASTSENTNKNGQHQLIAEGGKPEQVEFRYLTEFQSHEPEFDYLKSLEIEEKINTLKWCHQGANEGRFVLSTNDKTIKLWKVFEKRAEAVSGFNRDSNDSINTTTTSTGGAHNWGGNSNNRNNNENRNNKENNAGAGGTSTSNTSSETSYRLRIPRVLKGELGFSSDVSRCYCSAARVSH